MRKFFWLLSVVSGISFGSCAAGVNPTDISWHDYDSFQYGNSKLQQINISIANNRKSESGAILFIHGVNGGKMEYWTFLDHYKPEFVIGIMNYKIKNRNMKELIDDVDAAIAVMYNQASERNITIKNIIIIGHSFGGAIALNYSYGDFGGRIKVPVVLCVVLNAFSNMTDPNIMKLSMNRNSITRKIKNPVSTLLWLLFGKESKVVNAIVRIEDISFLAGSIGLVLSMPENYFLIGQLRNMSPVYRINENSPPVPAIIIHDKDDNIIPFSNSEILHNKLESLHIPNVFIITDKLGHDLGADGKKGVKIINYELETKLLDAIDRIVL